MDSILLQEGESGGHDHRQQNGVEEITKRVIKLTRGRDEVLTWKSGRHEKEKTEQRYH